MYILEHFIGYLLYCIILWFKVLIRTFMNMYLWTINQICIYVLILKSYKHLLTDSSEQVHHESIVGLSWTYCKIILLFKINFFHHLIIYISLFTLFGLEGGGGSLGLQKPPYSNSASWAKIRTDYSTMSLQMHMYLFYIGHHFKNWNLLDII